MNSSLQPTSTTTRPLRVKPSKVPKTSNSSSPDIDDLHFTVEDQIAEGDTVVSRWTARATQLGELLNIPPTGKQATVSGLTITHFSEGKIVEDHVNWDTLGLLQQLGVIPAHA